MWTPLLLTRDIGGRRGKEREEVLTSVLQKRCLTIKFELVCSLVSNFIQRRIVRVYASPLVTDCRLAQPVTPEIVCTPTPAGRLDKLTNLVVCLAKAGFVPTTSSMIGSEHTIEWDPTW